MPASAASTAAVSTICPAPRTPAAFPRWTVVGAAVAFVASFIGGHNGSPWWMVGWLPGLAGAFVSALWLEERITLPVQNKGAGVRALVFLAALAGGVVANVIGAVVLRTAFAILSVDTGAYLVCQLFAFWFVSAVLGGFPVLVVDAVGARFLPGFRHRVQLAVLILVGVATVVSVVVAELGITLVDAAKHDEPHVLLHDDNVAGFDIGAARFKNDVVPVVDDPAIIVLLSALVAALYGIPALLSSSSKLADSVTKRVLPLGTGFDRLAAGDRDIAVEEGGARELLHIARRFNAFVLTLKLAERLERAFGQYVSRHVLELIKGQHGEAMLPASTREASVFFADIRGFTSMSEKLSPEGVVAILNRYFSRVVKLVDEHDGYLNKFIGDAVVVVWNGPIDQPDHAKRATACAVALQRTVAEMNAADVFPEIGALNVGVGVATGPMVCGNIGGSDQMEYTVIGDTVNLASRLTSKAAAGEVWISEATARGMDGVERMEPITVKGKAEPVVPYRAWPAATTAATSTTTTTKG